MKKKYIIISIMLSFVILLTGTYAYLTWQSEENTNFTLSLGEVGEVLFSGGNEISATGIGPVLTMEEGEYTEFQILKKTDENFVVTIDFLPTVLPDELKDASLKYVILSKVNTNEDYVVLAEGDFEDKIEGTQFNIIEDEIINTTYYKFIIYMDGNMENPIDMQGKNFTGKVFVSYESAREIIDMKDTTVVYTYQTGTEEVFVVPTTGTYKLEAWGAQGGIDDSTIVTNYGGYSVGTIVLEKEQEIFINVGGQGGANTKDAISLGGYNGGGNGGVNDATASSRQGGAGGGGATSMALVSGLLKSLSSDDTKSQILIVAGGGGGTASLTGGSGGGYQGVDGGYNASYSEYHGTGATQTSGGYNYVTGSNYGIFGAGSSFEDEGYGGHGGGGGYYGGGGTNRSHSGGGGGSGYIGNSLLTNKYMYCYNCQTSDEESTKTYTTTNVSESPISNYAKQGNGYAKISLLVARLSNLEDKTILLGSEFDVTSDTSCVDAGNGCTLTDYQITNESGESYKNTSSITETGTYEIQYMVEDDNQVIYIYYRKLIVKESSGVQLINDLYSNAVKTSVSSNGVTYEYAQAVSMMTDVGGNIRYYGADPDNYIYFNCETYPNTNCEKWRIIGIFDGKIKIMRNEPIGDYSWDTSASGVNGGAGINQWGKSTYADGSIYEGADLMHLLNPGYESNSVNNSLYYNSGNGTCYTGKANATSTCDFSSTGLKNDETRNMISDTLYYLGASSSYVLSTLYANERGEKSGDSSEDNITRMTTWIGKIGLPYPSDYGYAADLSSCTVSDLYSYDATRCTSTNWMQPIFTSNVSWSMTPNSGSATNVFVVYSSGFCNVIVTAGQSGGVVPVLFLNSDVIIDPEVGTGDVNDPYRIVIS